MVREEVKLHFLWSVYIHLQKELSPKTREDAL
jgi:hypothetical protein